MTSQYVTPPGAPTPPPGYYPPSGGYGQAPPPAPPPLQRKRGLLATAGLVTAILLATAALVVGIIALSRPTPNSSPPSPDRTPAVATPTTKPTDTSTADRKLCEAVGPLLHESNETGKAFVNLGNPGTPPRDAGIPDYKTSVLDWARRIQPVLDSQPDADPFLRRTLQRMVDDIRVYATSIRPGPETDADAAAWNDATVAYGGPYDVCHQLGVQW
jgi:hypothetical protein